MKMITRYTTDGLFTLGEIRAMIAQTENLPDDVSVRLRGAGGLQAPPESKYDDVIELEWEEA